MKKLIVLCMMVLLVAVMPACRFADNKNSAETNQEEQTKEEEETAQKPMITLRMWGAEEDIGLLQHMIADFKEEYAEYADFTIELSAESEAEVKETVLTDVGAAADVYAFASDGLTDLVNAGALLSLDKMDAALEAYVGKSIEEVKRVNSAASVEAAACQDTLYAFPMSADNIYFLYYDEDVVTAEQAADWDSLLKAAAAADKKVGMTLASGWYNASFFYGAGFTTGLNADGTTSMDWNGAAEVSGVEVVCSMLDIAGNDAFLAIDDGNISNLTASGELCAVISGTWDAAAVKAAFGEGYAAARLPEFNCGDKKLQQTAAAGFRLVGVNPYSENAGWAVVLADWITNEENQALRFKERQTAPSNTAVADTAEVMENEVMAAIREQSRYSVIQQAGDNYRDCAKAFGQLIAEGALEKKDTEGIQKALDELVAEVTAPVQ